MTRFRIAFVLEQSLGHVTHGKNLQENVAHDPEVVATWLPIAYDPPAARRIPLLGDNWSVRASYRARKALRTAGAPSAFDAVFMHTQVTSLFSAHILRWGHGVVSLDATPRNYDALGPAYGHHRGPEDVESLKDALNRRAYAAARHLVTWSDWARQSLIRDYAVPPAKVTTIPPGTNLDLWEHMAAAPLAGERLRLLFVGGDFERKGGDLLLDVFRNRLAGQCELDIVTGSPVGPTPPGLRVHHGLAPNSVALRKLFAQADVFVLPTRADCLAMVLMEAMAARLPIVTTRVGALGEAVRDGDNGILVEPDDGVALAEAIERLLSDAQLRQRMGTAGYERAQQRFDARHNQRRLLALLKSVASHGAA